MKSRKTKMKKTAMLIAVTLAIGAILIAGLAWANGTPRITRYVIAGGGGYSESTGGNYAIYGTIGQPVAGQSDELCSGFWCGAVAGYKIYLPLVLRNA